jgi:hypothetical protein
VSSLRCTCKAFRTIAYLLGDNQIIHLIIPSCSHQHSSRSSDRQTIDRVSIYSNKASTSGKRSMRIATVTDLRRDGFCRICLSTVRLPSLTRNKCDHWSWGEKILSPSILLCHLTTGLDSHHYQLSKLTSFLRTRTHSQGHRGSWQPAAIFSVGYRAMQLVTEHGELRMFIRMCQ